jgi:predicted permease
MKLPFFGWVRPKLFRAGIARDIQDELEFHLHMRRTEYEGAGKSRRAARRDALHRFGDYDRVESACRAIHRLPNKPRALAIMIESLWQDIRYAVRTLRQHPSFTVIAVLTVGLGIGANTVTFSVVNTTLLQPLPFDGAERYVRVWRKSDRGSMRITPTAEMIAAVREHATSFDAVATYSSTRFVVSEDGEPRELGAAVVSPELIPMLGLRVELGRPFTPSDTTPGQDKVVLLTEAFWKREFAADPDVVGRTLRLDDEAYTIIGVLPAKADLFFGDTDRELWVPGKESTPTVARLRPGVSIEQALAEIQTIHAEGNFEPGMAEDWPLDLLPHNDRLASDLRTGLWVLLGAVGFVLLVACVNVANMVLARGMARSHEMAIRAALGAGKLRVVRQLVTESLLFTILGAAVGIALAHASLGVIMANLPEGLRQVSARIDGYVLAATLGVSVVTGLIFGLVPAGQLRSLKLNQALSHGQRSGSGAPRGSTARQSLLAAEVALALLLVLGAGLMVKSLRRLAQLDPGFDPTNVVSFRVNPPEARYAGFEQQDVFYADVLSRIRQLPNVERAALGAVEWIGFMEGVVRPDGAEVDADAPKTGMTMNLVSEGYFATVGMALREGRGFTADDAGEDSRSVVVNEAFARAYWPGEPAAGKQFRINDGERPYHVIGVARDLRVNGLNSDPDRLQVYYPYDHFQNLSFQTIVVRGVGSPDDLIPLLKGQVWSVDPTLPLKDIKVATEELLDAIARPRFNALALSSFAALAVLLAAIGIYGVISLTLQQRTHELGVRLALGTKHADVSRLMIAHGMKPILIGAAIGIGLSIGLTRYLRTLLFEVEPTDPVTYATVVPLLLLVGVVACYWPARRVTRLDPVQALRQE